MWASKTMRSTSLGPPPTSEIQLLLRRRLRFFALLIASFYGILLPSGYIPAWPQTLAVPLCFGLMTVAYLAYLYSVVTNRD